MVLKVLENPLKPIAHKGRSYIQKGSVNYQTTSIEIAGCLLKSTSGSTDAVFVWGNESDKKGDKKILEFLKNNPIATIKDMRELTGPSSGGY